ncbi:Putative mitochondrial ribosomal protein new15, mitochondrial [Psilocybe cubensis]|uniref:50S ribosomal protein L35 n=2 Tax=Psilocybe cubensis TaxID=181762 RepID=A0A8H8CLA3_PSICU|nr:Putative mitochondrial ribosomal protein new15, mitochondrial [Psilocybe cubensis]KAH9480418.1 Putative mitochondrial ribosomal protein new15, mitochondrial [Psilocybe cubensis]
MFSFGRQLLWSAKSCLRAQQQPWQSAASRLFSTTQPVEGALYKMKTHSGAKKRWRSLGSGSSFKRGKAGHQHLNVSKPPGRKNRLSTTAYSNSAQTHKLKKLLLPYGSG